PRAGDMQRAIAAATPLGRLGTPEEFARVVAFLASDQARWITGQVVLADGGLSLGAPLLAPPPARGTSGGGHRGEDDHSEDPVAVVGMGLAVAGASSPDELWRVRLDGPDLLVTVPAERWHPGRFHSSGRAAAPARRDPGRAARAARGAPAARRRGQGPARPALPARRGRPAPPAPGRGGPRGDGRPAARGQRRAHRGHGVLLVLYAIDIA